MPKTLSQTDGALFWKITEGRKPMASYAQTLSEEAMHHMRIRANLTAEEHRRILEFLKSAN